MSRVPLPDDVDPRELDPQARQELRSLVRETADLVARHLVMTGRLLDDEPEQALAHARAARALAGRIGVVREASGLAAYAAGEWQEALSELRAARRITGEAGHLAVLADCERALGRPERALAVADDPDVPRLKQDERVELVIVLSGARRDLGQADAAVLLLKDPATRTSAARPWAARLWYAYADALLAAGREEQAREWFDKTAGIDLDGQTDAGDRLLELDGVVVDDEPDEDGDLADLPDADELAEVAQQVVRAHDLAEGAAAVEVGEADDEPAVPRVVVDEAPTPAATGDAVSVGDDAAADLDADEQERSDSAEADEQSSRDEADEQSSRDGADEQSSPDDADENDSPDERDDDRPAAVAPDHALVIGRGPAFQAPPGAEEAPPPPPRSTGPVASPTFTAPADGDDPDLRLFD